MPGALGDVLDAIQVGLSEIPPAVLLLGLLFGPTLAWIGYRLYVAPRSERPQADHDDLFWICPECRSANEVGRRRCYLCQTDRDAIDGAIRVVDRDQILELDEGAAAADSPGVAVGPGRPAKPGIAASHDQLPTSGSIVPFERSGKRSLEALGARPPMAVPIEPELDDDDDDDVVAASQRVDGPPPRRRKRSTKRDAAS
jgi:hypothetical protein